MDEDLLEVARSVRPCLRALVGADAARVDRALVELLARAGAGEDVDDELADLLLEGPALRDWAAAVLGDPLHRPPELQEPRRSVGLTGAGAPVAAARFACPRDGAYVWWRPSVGVPVPACPDHAVPLVAG